VAGTHEHSAPIGLCVVNAVGDRHSVGIRAKIMILDQDGFAIPFGAGIFEVANWFLLLRVDTDDGQSLAGKSFPLPPHVKELLIAIGVLGGGDLLAVHAELAVHVFEQAAHRVLAHGDAPSGEFYGDLARRAPTPLHPGNGVTGRVVPHQFFDAGDDFGRFFSARLRPPPALRMRSTARSCSRSSRRPLATVCGSRPMNSAIRRSPP
jgi:hypothetical protein